VILVTSPALFGGLARVLAYAKGRAGAIAAPADRTDLAGQPEHSGRFALRPR
jgi:hypothetical protein